jgi:predicted short-subunit dehydrogenase-like oxidoreductase (DUF2520 family)
MLPGMSRKPRMAIIGPGNLGTALALSLKKAGFTIDALVSRSHGKSRQRAGSLAKRAGARLVTTLDGVDSDLMWFCVPDAEIARAARTAAAQAEWKGRVALHSSGALTSDELDALRQQGASVASVHPLMTFVRGSQPSLAGVPFAIEGDAPAVRQARRIVRELGGQSYPIRKQDKAAYHAWGAFASPLLTVLLTIAERVAAKAGVKRRDAVRRMMPILQQTLANYSSLGAAAGFSGPIVRGDVETVKRHLRKLKSVPAARDVYLSLARAALLYLPAKDQAALRKAFQSGESGNSATAALRRQTTSSPRTTNGKTAAVRSGRANTALE